MKWMSATILCLITGIFSSTFAQSWNDPYITPADNNTYLSAFVSPPKTLDPAQAYEETEIGFIAQIYEPPLQYAYLKRPYTLEPLVAQNLPTVRYYDAKGQALPSTAPPALIAFTTYDITIKPGIYYQP